MTTPGPVLADTHMDHPHNEVWQLLNRLQYEGAVSHVVDAKPHTFTNDYVAGARNLPLVLTERVEERVGSFKLVAVAPLGGFEVERSARVSLTGVPCRQPTPFK